MSDGLIFSVNGEDMIGQKDRAKGRVEVGAIAVLGICMEGKGREGGVNGLCFRDFID